VGNLSINFNELRDLLGAIAQTDITELTLKTEEFELSVKKGGTQIPLVAPAIVTQEAIIPPPAVTESISAVLPEPPKETPSLSATEKKWTAITSPMVGTFYRASGPDEAPFVDMGESIQKGQTVCIIEAMKLMNEIEAEISGQVMEIAVANGEPVEYGQTLLWVKTS